MSINSLRVHFPLWQQWPGQLSFNDQCRSGNENARHRWTTVRAEGLINFSLWRREDVRGIHGRWAVHREFVRVMVSSIFV